MNTASENACNARNTKYSYHVQHNKRGKYPILSTVCINLAYTLVMLLFGVVGWQKFLAVSLVLQNKNGCARKSRYSKFVKLAMLQVSIVCSSFQQGSWPLCCATGCHNLLSWGIVPVNTVWMSLYVAHHILHDACSQTNQMTLLSIKPIKKWTAIFCQV